MNVLARLPVLGSTVVRQASAQDVPTIVKLLAADQLGATRDGITTVEDLEPYLRPFESINTDPAHLLLVATGDE